ncbi:hypothetical protein SLEP1_g4503 [Rubroshorea leprosula]|uniref:Cytochrome P450 n=1 Tax=Rubroshorea leprosula TaxID=152421 RepID=A0AAV5HX14_9ROSI|nr:hypothetical protein SLEP1_g4503 [Rubroshorea leprosula]
MVALMIMFLVSMLLQLFWVVFQWPYWLTERLKKQGIISPPYKLLIGFLNDMRRMKKTTREMILDSNSKDVVQKVLPHYHTWSLECDSELAKQILSKYGFYVKPRLVPPAVMTLVGKGLIFVEGSDWVWHKRIINPAFSLEKLKVKVKRTAACAITMLEEWEDLPTMTEDGSKKIEMSEEFKKLSADIIAHTAFREATQAKGDLKLNMNEIMEECKTFFISGHETTRVNMLLLEVLRLDCPVITTIREASEDMTLGNLMIPKHTYLVKPLVKIQTSKEYCEEDANEFNPLKFMNGTSNAAKDPNALLAFSTGPRACIGQNSAMLEAKNCGCLDSPNVFFLPLPGVQTCCRRLLYFYSLNMASLLSLNL